MKVTGQKLDFPTGRKLLRRLRSTKKVALIYLQQYIFEVQLKSICPVIGNFREFFTFRDLKSTSGESLFLIVSKLFENICLDQQNLRGPMEQPRPRRGFMGAGSRRKINGKACLKQLFLGVWGMLPGNF